MTLKLGKWRIIFHNQVTSVRGPETAKKKEVEEPGTLELEVPIENTSQTQAGPNSKPSLKEE